MEKTDKSYQDILKLVHNLQKEIKELRKENTELKARIHKLEHPKNSNNSSIPPSSLSDLAIKAFENTIFMSLLLS